MANEEQGTGTRVDTTGGTTDSPTAAVNETKSATFTPHSPLPWRVVGRGGELVAIGGRLAVAFDESGESTAQDRANAAFVVHAANNYYGLLAALKQAAELIPAPATDGACHRYICSVEQCGRCSRSAVIYAAIAKAEGGHA
jgi:hypothetical protein